MMVVGQFASSALAAVDSSSTLVKLLIGCSQGLTVGADILIARRVGSGKTHLIQRALHCAMALSILLGVAIAAAGLALSVWLLKIVNTPPELMTSATIYFHLYILGLPAQLVNQFGSAALRAKEIPENHCGFCCAPELAYCHEPVLCSSAAAGSFRCRNGSLYHAIRVCGIDSHQPLLGVGSDAPATPVAVF